MANLKIIRLHMERVGPAPRGSRVETTQDGALIRSLLIAKAHEEAHELENAATEAERLSELADVLEVVRALALVHGLHFQDVLDRADVKLKERGPLTYRIGGTRDRYAALLLRREPWMDAEED